MNNPSKNNGIVLLIVLGILGLMSVLAVSFVSIARLERTMSRNYVDRTRATMAAESGIEYALGRINNFRGGTFQADESLDLAFVPGSEEGLDKADRASFQMEGVVDHPISGIVSSSYTPDGDYFILKVKDDSGKLNLNDSNGAWNLDDDPLLDGGPTDLEAIDPPGRLYKIVEALGDSLFSAPTGTAMANAMFDTDPTIVYSRSNLVGERFQSMEEVKTALTEGYVAYGIPAALDENQFKEFENYVTLWGWQDPNVLRPTFQLKIHTDKDDAVQSKDEFNIYQYSDFQTSYFELEPRSPINVNTATLPLITALIRPVQGWYLYEGMPSSLQDGAYGPYNKVSRYMSQTYGDKIRDNGFANGGSWFCPKNLAFASGSRSCQTAQGDWDFGNGTRYGEARITQPLDAIADELASRIYDHVHHHPSGELKPFTTWDEFSRFLYSMVDTGAIIATDQVSANTPLDINLGPDEEAARFPYFLERGSSFVIEETIIPDFTRYQADALLANFNPNSQLNDHNPDFHIFRHVDKTQLTSYTTELCFESTGIYSIQSLGYIEDTNGQLVSQSLISTVLQLSHILRFTTQAQFMGTPKTQGYDRSDHSSLYDLFWESDGFSPTAGADLNDGDGAITSTWGPSIMSYPEPLRRDGNVSIEDNPTIPDSYKNGSWFSPFEGYLMLSTYQMDSDGWSSVMERNDPGFLATMGYRDRSVETADQWKNRTLAMGGLMPVRYGKNNTVISDDINDMDAIGSLGGRAAMLAWETDYTAPDVDSGVFPTLTDNIPDLSFIHDHPWEDKHNWVTYPVNNQDHYWGTDGIALAWGITFIFPISDKTPVRMGWNLPSDLPVTPAVEGGQMQGNLFPDGAFCDAGRGVAYRSTNMGSDFGTKGSIAFWFKPHFDTGFSNRIRNFFSMGEPGMGYQSALQLTYFPSSVRPPDFVYDPGLGTSSGTPIPKGPTEEAVQIGPALGWRNSLDWSRTPGHEPWALATHSLFFGWASQSWHTVLLGSGGTGVVKDTAYRTTQTATDYFPFRSATQTAEPLAFYGHSWNFFAGTYNAKSILVPSSGTNANYFSVNGNEIVAPILAEHFGFGPGSPKVDWWWQETPSTQIYWFENGLPQKPRNIQIGERYIRFGFNGENAGPVADATIDDVVAWPNYFGANLAPITFAWQQGRYLSEPLSKPDGTNLTSLSAHLSRNKPADTVVGLYTSPKIDLKQILQGDSSKFISGNISLRSVSWTLNWPRYNNRPGRGFDTIQGVDIHNYYNANPADFNVDPVTGTWDPITIDIVKPDDTWLFSEDDNADPSHSKLFDNIEEMLYDAGGQALQQNSPRYAASDTFQFRVYFHNDPGQKLMESPVLDDITFHFVPTKPTVFYYSID